MKADGRLLAFLHLPSAVSHIRTKQMVISHKYIIPHVK